jgi:ketosteroid isomerase-like protein
MDRVESARYFTGMSEANLEVVRRAIAALNDRDVDAYLALCTPDIELVSPLAPIEGPSIGPEGIRQFFSGLDEVASLFRLEIEELRLVRADRVVALLGLAFESTGGIPLPQRIANIYDLVGGKLKRVRVYLDRGEALEAAALPG